MQMRIEVDGQRVTIEDLARAWASIDGKRDQFDEGKGIPFTQDETGHYAGYMEETVELVTRAVGYAVASNMTKN